MTTLSQSQYAFEMRAIEEQRNAACRQGDRLVVHALRERGAALTRLFFGARG